MESADHHVCASTKNKNAATIVSSAVPACAALPSGGLLSNTGPSGRTGTREAVDPRQASADIYEDLRPLQPGNALRPSPQLLCHRSAMIRNAQPPALCTARTPTAALHRRGDPSVVDSRAPLRSRIRAAGTTQHSTPQRTNAQPCTPMRARDDSSARQRGAVRQTRMGGPTECRAVWGVHSCGRTPSTPNEQELVVSA